MTVKELIEALQQHPQNDTVVTLGIQTFLPVTSVRHSSVYGDSNHFVVID